MCQTLSAMEVIKLAIGAKNLANKNVEQMGLC
jgi:hypothetical protein